MEQDSVSLGGNIELAGFNALDSGSLVILKKIIGNYAKRLSKKSDKFEKIKLTMKTMHEREKSEIYEVKGHLFLGGNPIFAEESDRNLFFALDKVLKRIDEQVG